MFHFVYNSYELWGRNYIGVHSTSNVEDNYFGSFVDPTFKPVARDVLAFYETREQACEAEMLLHDFFDVANNPNFANQAKAHNTGSYPFTLSDELKREAGRKGGKVRSEKKLTSATQNVWKGTLKTSKAVTATNTLTGETFFFYSCREASRKTGLHLQQVYDLLKGRKEETKSWKLVYT